MPAYAGYDAHNNYVRFTTEAGIPGIVAMVLLLLALFALSRRVLKADDSLETRLVGTAFNVAVLGVIFSNGCSAKRASVTGLEPSPACLPSNRDHQRQTKSSPPRWRMRFILMPTGPKLW